MFYVNQVSGGDMIQHGPFATRDASDAFARALANGVASNARRLPDVERLGGMVMFKIGLVASVVSGVTIARTMPVQETEESTLALAA